MHFTHFQIRLSCNRKGLIDVRHFLGKFGVLHREDVLDDMV